MKMPVLTLLALNMALGGCATLSRGSNDILSVYSEPEGASVTTSNGYSCEATPCNITPPRRSEFEVVVSMPGCKDHRTMVTHKTARSGAAGMAGNFVFGNLFGFGVDAATGATQELVPNYIDARLDCG